MLDLFMQPETWATLIVLAALEIVLSIDNLVFIALLSNRLPANKQKKARRLGLLLAVGFRIALLSVAAWLVQLTAPLFTAFGHGFSVRDIVLILGGLFLIWKSTVEIRDRVTVRPGCHTPKTKAATVTAIILQIIVIDIVFSIDSIITAVGLAQELSIMILAVLIAVGVMILASEPLATFINRNPTIVMLALAFLVMIGMTLVGEGIGYHVPKNLIYAAMGFSLGVELLNMWQRKTDARTAQAQMATLDANLDR